MMERIQYQQIVYTSASNSYCACCDKCGKPKWTKDQTYTGNILCHCGVHEVRDFGWNRNYLPLSGTRP